MGLAPSVIGQLKAEHQQGLKSLRDDYLRDPNPRRLLAARCAQIDNVLRRLGAAHGLPDSLALIAVGGYGRGELYPASDVDLLILLPDEPDVALRTQLEKLVGIFWDIGLEVGHSVRTIETCLQEAAADITVETTLLESRLLTGNAALFAQFTEALRGLLDPAAFFIAKRLEQDERYQRFQETAYSLEPNCKESPGGLRDLQTIIWIAKACGCGGSWPELKTNGLITGEEVVQLEQCEKLLQDIRIRLHFQTGRREDRLLFDVQEALARQLGYEPQTHRRASELMMQVYFRNAKAITQLNTILLQNIGTVLFPPRADMPPQRINDRFAAFQDLLDVVDEDVFRRTPSAILESFLLLQQHAELKGMTARTLRALYRARFLVDAEYRANPEHRKLFLELMRSPRGIVRVFRRMNQYGILGRYLPAFARIVGQMQHDLFHAYTVDQHILQVMRNLRRLTMDEFAHELPFESRLINAFSRPWLLYIAALFHDIAKGRGGDHSELGTVDAAEFCRDHGIVGDDAELVVWLVREHLTMSQIAQKEDIGDPETVRSFAARVKDERHLTALYLLTVSDIRGTSPKVWNGWKAQLLEGLYNAARRRLTGGGSVDGGAHGVIEERQQEAMRLLRYFALSDTVHERLWNQLDTVYFLRHSAEEIAWHTRALHYRIFNDQPIVKARLYRRDEETPTHSGGLQVMVYTHDQPELFVHLAGFFARAGFSIVDAKIHTTKHGYALDSFILLDVQERHTDRELISYIEHELVERLQSGKFDAVPTSGRLSRQVRHFPFQPSVSIRPDAKGTQYVLSIVAADRPGLLYTVAAALARHGVNLYTAKIATLGERVEDTFLIGGGDLTKVGSLLRLETELLDVLKI